MEKLCKGWKDKNIDVKTFWYSLVSCFNWMWRFVFHFCSGKDNDKALKSDMIYSPYFEISAALW